jgi:DNA-binding IclR family transcriptional regulator
MQLLVGVTGLAADTGIPKTTVHRLFKQLADQNVVERVEPRGVSEPPDLDRRRPTLASVAHPRRRSFVRATGAARNLLTQP